MASHFPRKMNSVGYRTICAIPWIFSYFNRHSGQPSATHISVCILWFVTWHLPLSQFTFMEFECVFDFSGMYAVLYYYIEATNADANVESPIRTLYIDSVFENHFNLSFDSMSIYQFNEISYYLHTVHGALKHWALCMMYEHNNSDRENHTRPKPNQK